MPGFLSGLSVKLISTIIVAILLVEIAIYVPSVANYRASWLEDRLQVGIVAARVLDAVPDVMALPRALTDRLLNSAGATAIVYRRQGKQMVKGIVNLDFPIYPGDTLVVSERWM